MRIEVFAHEQLGFERAEERLAHRVVIGVARGAHRRLHVCLAAAAPERNRRILGEFNRSSQQSLMQVMIDVRVAFRQEFSNRELCEADY